MYSGHHPRAQRTPLIVSRHRILVNSPPPGLAPTRLQDSLSAKHFRSAGSPFQTTLNVPEIASATHLWREPKRFFVISEDPNPHGLCRSSASTSQIDTSRPFA